MWGSRKPIVNVIVPTYSRSARLSLALASIWGQDGLGETFDLEPIVVDDGSPQPARDVVGSFPGTRYVRLDTNRGLACARNAGLAEATGDYVAFLDDDDLWLPHRLVQQIRALEAAEETKIAYSRSVVCSSEGDTYLDPPDGGPSGTIFEHVFKQDASNLFTMLIPRAVLDKVGGFDESFPATPGGMVEGIETDMVLRLALAFPFEYVPRVVTVIVPSAADHRDPEVRRAALLRRKEKILSLVAGRPNEAHVRTVVTNVTPWHVVRRFGLAGDFEGARLELLGWFHEAPSLLSDPWVRARLGETIPELALRSDSPIETTRSLCAELERLGGHGEAKGVVAQVWTRVAMGLARGRRRDDRKAAVAAARAIRAEPRKVLSRPGLLRLLARPIR